MEVKDVKKLCDELSEISSTTEKKAWLVENACSELNTVFKFLFDPSIVTGINKKKLTTNVGTVYATGNLNDLLMYLRKHNTGTNYDIAVAQDIIDNLSCGNKDIKQWLCKLVTKTLKIGVNVKTLNDVYGDDYIYIHEVQLGSPRDKLRLKDGEEFWLTQKLNGVRATFVDGKLISRQGKVFNGLNHITSLLSDFNKLYVFDGELIRKNIDNISDNENFRIGTGVLNSDTEDKSCIEFVVFDIIPIEEYKSKKGKILYETRRLAMDVFPCCKNVRFVETLYHGSNIDQIDKMLKYADSQGWEGLMLNKNAPYEFKRTTNLIKIKTFHFSDLKIVNVFEGDGKYAGTLGAIQVEYKGNVVNVGSGFTDEERNLYWEKRHELIGKIMEVKYKEESTDKNTNLKSLQFPVFSKLRDDKSEVSYE